VAQDAYGNAVCPNTIPDVRLDVVTSADEAGQAGAPDLVVSGEQVRSACGAPASQAHAPYSLPYPTLAVCFHPALLPNTS
jgi:hypothetical protein